MAFDGQEKIFDAGRLEPMRTRSYVAKDEDGHEVIRAERRPRGRGLYMIDSMGSEIWLRLTNAIANDAERDPWGQEILSSKCAQNPKWKTEPMIPAAHCPQMTEHQYKLPTHLQTGRRCESAVDGAPVGEDRSGNRHYCKCITQLQKERRERNDKIEAMRDPRTTIQEALLNNSQATTAKLTDLLSKLTATPELTPTPRSGKATEK